jgi:hypothetical protein
MRNVVMRPSSSPYFGGAQLKAFRVDLLALMLLPWPSAQAQSVSCDRFALRATPQGNELLVSLETDLPDATVVMVSVSRSYWAGTPVEEYPLDYYEARSTVADWRRPRTISIDDAVWRRQLDERLRLLALAGEAARPARIGNAILVSFTVPVNQPDPRFGPGNRNLVGARVAKRGLRVVAAESRIRRPLGAGAASAASQYASAQGLRAGVTYRLSRETPLAPERRPSDPLRAIAATRRLPPGTLVTVSRIDRSDAANPWYHVAATTAGGTQLGTGWINSIALIGQEITVMSRSRAHN